MAVGKNFIQIPPDSTGKLVRMTHTAQVKYVNLNPTNYIFKSDQEYTIKFSGAGETSVAKTVHIHNQIDTGSGTGYIEIHYPESVRYKGQTPDTGTGATIGSLDDSVLVGGYVSEVSDYYVNSNHIVGYDNPEYGVNVDSTGSINVRFSEGLPQLDAFGKLRTSGATILGDYVFSDTVLPQFCTSTSWGTGSSVGHNINLRCLQLTTPASSSATADGSFTDTTEMTESSAIYASHTTNTYHHYFPGFSQNMVMTVALNNSEGEANVVREWGYFDDKNGYFFRLNGTVSGGDGLECVIRSSTSGSVKEISISKSITRYLTLNASALPTETDTESIGWSNDPLDGTGNSGKTLNLKSDNIYWIDIQWLGAGRVRFGTYHQGQRVVIHEYNHDDNGTDLNKTPGPHSQTGSLPLRARQYIKAGGSTGVNESKLFWWCGSVITEATVDLSTQGFSQVQSFEVTVSANNINDWKGLNDSYFGDRTGVIKTGNVTTSGTTLTLGDNQDISSIKPGYRLHIHAQNGGTGVIDEENIVTVKEISNTTQIILSSAPDTDFDGLEDVKFHLNVDHEYNLVGVLSPRQYLGSQTDHRNRTVYIPKSFQAWAYHAINGDPAYCELEIYTQPIISGNNRAVNASDGPLQLIDSNNSYGAVNSYEFSDGRMNYFGGGYHNSINFLNGVSEVVDLTGQYANYQAGAFKIYSDDGGNNRCPILRIYQSPAAGVATVVQINTLPTLVDFTRHRENPTPIRFEGIPGAIGTDGTYGLNYSDSGLDFYIRHLDKDKLELYTDANFTTPHDTSTTTTGIVTPAVGAATISTTGPYNPGSPAEDTQGGLTWPGNTGTLSNGGFIISGYGDWLYFAIVVKPVGPSATYDVAKGDIVVHYKLTWNEIPA